MKLIYYILTLILSAVSVEGDSAIWQIPDRLIYKNDTLLISSYPLEQLSNIDSLRKKLVADSNEYWNSDCRRGYQAEWTVIDNHIFLTGIFSCNNNNDKVKFDLQQLFGEKYNDGKVKADWVSAKVLSTQGKQLYYAYSGYESIYEKEVIFEFASGYLIGKETYDNSKSKTSIYSEETTLLKFIYSNIKWETLPKNDKSVRVIIRFSGNEQGIIDSAIVIRGFNPIFDNEALRVVKSIPYWDIYYRHGKYERRSWDIPIIFNEEYRQKYKQN